MKRKQRLLIVEDEPAIATGLVDVFVFHGYEVDRAADGCEGLRKATSGRFDLILLDVMLPCMDGFTVCNRIRAADRSQPIILLTARTSDADIVQGLSLGADDYVGKPFSVAQLVLRVQAVLRRASPVYADDVMQLGPDWQIDVPNLRGNSRQGTTVIFTSREIALLQYLHTHSSRPVPREELLAKVWGYGNNAELETRTVDIHIAKLRKKIEADPANPCLLLTVRGAGYKLVRE